MGSIGGGIDRTRQADWLAERRVHRQEPCRSCWARYLCGGGCHHEVIRRGRPACDYIRGWLHYCLGAYLRLSQAGGAANAERQTATLAASAWWAAARPPPPSPPRRRQPTPDGGSGSG